MHACTPFHKLTTKFSLAAERRFTSLRKVPCLLCRNAVRIMSRRRSNMKKHVSFKLNKLCFSVLFILQHQAPTSGSDLHLHKGFFQSIQTLVIVKLWYNSGCQLSSDSPMDYVINWIFKGRNISSNSHMMLTSAGGDKKDTDCIGADCIPRLLQNGRWQLTEWRQMERPRVVRENGKDQSVWCTN